MATELVPIKVKIGLNVDGSAKYPNFNVLEAVREIGIDWTRYVDTYGTGWHYDQTSGHADDTPDSPRGQQWGVLMVPEEFADEAVEIFEEVTELTEEELEDFYDNKAHVRDADELMDMKVLQGLQAKVALGIPLTEDQKNAINPDHPSAGVRKNPKKKWKDLKETSGLKIKRR